MLVRACPDCDGHCHARCKYPMKGVPLPLRLLPHLSQRALTRRPGTYAAIAKQLGYFWLPCPLCGELFAGFEPWGIGLPVLEGDELYFCGVCTAPGCQYEAYLRNWCEPLKAWPT